jgi:thiamine biosynthesis lipoprotein
LYAHSQERADMLAALAIAEVERINDKYSRYSPVSFLSQLNRSAGSGETVMVDDETAALLDYAFACFAKSGGLFDITAGVLRRAWNFASGRLPEADAIRLLLPRIGMEKLFWKRPYLRFTAQGMEIDLGGIGKEYAVDRVASLLAEEGVEHGFVELGGDFFAWGPHPDGRPWPIGIRDPHRESEIAGVVAIECGALATSGDYARCIEAGGKRYSHILNPRTGWPATGLSSVTATAAQCMVAGSLTTIALLKGREGIHWLAAMGQPHLWMDEEGRNGGTLPLMRTRQADEPRV